MWKINRRCQYWLNFPPVLFCVSVFFFSFISLFHLLTPTKAEPWQATWEHGATFCLWWDHQDFWELLPQLSQSLLCGGTTELQRELACLVAQQNVSSWGPRFPEGRPSSRECTSCPSLAKRPGPQHSSAHPSKHLWKCKSASYYLPASDTSSLD